MPSARGAARHSAERGWPRVLEHGERVLLLVGDHQVGTQVEHGRDVDVLGAADHRRARRLDGQLAVARAADDLRADAERVQRVRVAGDERHDPLRRLRQPHVAAEIVADSDLHARTIACATVRRDGPFEGARGALEPRPRRSRGRARPRRRRPPRRSPKLRRRRRCTSRAARGRSRRADPAVGYRTARLMLVGKVMGSCRGRASEESRRRVSPAVIWSVGAARVRRGRSASVAASGRQAV